MSKISSELGFLLKHSSIYGIGNILSKLVAFILLPLYTRYLTPQDYGVLELLDVTTGMIGIVVSIGIAEALSRFYYTYEKDKDRNTVVSTAYIITVTIGIISALIFIGISEYLAELILDSKKYTIYFELSFLALVIGLIIDLGQVYLRILQRSVMFISISMIHLVIGVSLNVYFIVFLQQGVLGILYANVLSKLIVGTPVAIWIVKKVGLRFKSSLAKEMLVYSAPLIPSHLAHSFVGYSDRYFIKHFASIQDAGIYGIANKIGTAIHMLFTSPFIMTFIPRRFEIANREDARDIFASVYQYYLIGITVIAMFVSVYAKEIVDIMTTKDYLLAAEIIPIICFTMVLLGLKYHFEFGILYSKKTKYYLYVNGITAVLHLALNMLLISRYGIYGAALAALLSTAFNVGFIYIVSNRLYDINYDFSLSMRLLFLSIAMFYLAKWVETDQLLLSILYKTLIMAAYFSLMPLLKVVTIREVVDSLNYIKSKIQGSRVSE